MEKVISDLLTGLHLDPWLILLAMLALIFIPLALKGVHALTNTRYSRRKDAIELWQKKEVVAHDLSLETLVRHAYGYWLPAPTIRAIDKMFFPGMILIELREFRQFLEPDGETGKLKIKGSASTSNGRTALILAFAVGYFITAMLAFASMGFFGLPNSLLPTTLRVILGIIFSLIAYYFIDNLTSLLRLNRFTKKYSALFLEKSDPRPAIAEAKLVEETPNKTS